VTVPNPVASMSFMTILPRVEKVLGVLVAAEVGRPARKVSKKLTILRVNHYPIFGAY